MHPNAGSSSRPGTQRNPNRSNRVVSDAEMRLQEALLARAELLALSQTLKSKSKKYEAVVEVAEKEIVAPKQIDEPVSAFPVDDCVDFSCLYSPEFVSEFDFDAEGTEFTSGIELVLSPFSFDNEPPQTVLPPPPEAPSAKAMTHSKIALSAAASTVSRNAGTKKFIVIPQDYAIEDVYDMDYSDDSDESVISIDSLED